MRCSDPKETEVSSRKISCWATENKAGEDAGTAAKAVTDAIAAKNVTIDIAKDVKDAIIEDNEFEKKVTNCVKKICEVEIYPENELNMASFRDRVVDYFKKKNEVIEKVIRCDIEKDG